MIPWRQIHDTLHSSRATSRPYIAQNLPFQPIFYLNCFNFSKSHPFLDRHEIVVPVTNLFFQESDVTHQVNTHIHWWRQRIHWWRHNDSDRKKHKKHSGRVILTVMGNWIYLVRLVPILSNESRNISRFQIWPPPRLALIAKSGVSCEAPGTNKNCSVTASINPINSFFDLIFVDVKRKFSDRAPELK